MKSLSILKEYIYKSKHSTTSEVLTTKRATSAIEDMCNRYLKDSSTILEFEIIPSLLDVVLEIIEDDKMLTKYEFAQIDAYKFQVRMRELNIM